MQYFEHALIGLISEHERMNKVALQSLSGMNRKVFNGQFQKLIKDGHLIDGEDQLYPRCLKITVIDKASKRFIKNVDINYISRDDLKDIIYYNENSEDFLEGAMLGENQRTYFELHNNFVFDFEKSDYWLYVGYANLSFNPLKGFAGFSDAKIPVVHLDDHSCFSKGLETLFKNRFFQDFEWNYFSESDEALRFIWKELEADRYIHFIITDITHPGLNGYEFAKKMRKLEGLYNYRKTPIIALTMHDSNSPLMIQAKEENLFDAHFTKNADIEVIFDFVNNIF